MVLNRVRGLRHPIQPTQRPPERRLRENRCFRDARSADRHGRNGRPPMGLSQRLLFPFDGRLASYRGQRGVREAGSQSGNVSAIENQISPRAWRSLVLFIILNLEAELALATNVTGSAVRTACKKIRAEVNRRLCIWMTCSP